MKTAIDDFDMESFNQDAADYLKGKTMSDILLILMIAYHKAYDSDIRSPTHERILFRTRRGTQNTGRSFLIQIKDQFTDDMFYPRPV